MTENNNYIVKISNNKYINIESYKKNGSYVRTPVLFVNKDDKIYFRTNKKSGKIKRIKNNSSIKFTPCNINGKVKDMQWKEGYAKIANTDVMVTIDRLFGQKYGIINKFLKLLYKIRKLDLVLVEVKLLHDTE